eukprot:255967_1
MTQEIKANSLHLTFHNSHNTSHNKAGNIEIPWPEIGLHSLQLSNLLSFGNKLLGIETGKEIYFESGDRLTDDTIIALKNGDNLFIHDNIYPHGQKIDEPIRIAIVGPGAVGKSAITQRIVNGEFKPDYDPTIDDLFEKIMNIDGHRIVVNILDTAGQEDFKGLREGQMKNKNGYIFVYSIVNFATFEDLENFYDTLLDVLDSEYSGRKPMILCGNKIDLPEHEITEDERNEKERQWIANKQYLTSAKNGHNIKNMIGWLVREIINDLYPTEIEAPMIKKDYICCMPSPCTRCVLL